MLCINQTIGHGLQIGPVFIHFRTAGRHHVRLAIDAPEVYRVARNATLPAPKTAIRELTGFSEAHADQINAMVKRYYAAPANFRYAYQATKTPLDHLTLDQLGTLQLLAETVLRTIQRDEHHAPETTP